MDNQIESDLAVIDSEIDQIKSELVDILFRSHDDGLGEVLNEAIEKMLKSTHDAGGVLKIFSLMAEIGHCEVLKSMANHPSVNENWP